jgi:hypothetical protein
VHLGPSWKDLQKSMLELGSENYSSLCHTPQTVYECLLPLGYIPAEKFHVFLQGLAISIDSKIGTPSGVTTYDSWYSMAPTCVVVHKILSARGYPYPCLPLVLSAAVARGKIVDARKNPEDQEVHPDERTR